MTKTLHRSGSTLISFVCYQGFKKGRERKEKREEEINKLNKAVETMTEVNRNLAQDVPEITAYLTSERAHTHTHKHKDRHLST